MIEIIIRLLMALEAVVCLMLIGIILLQRSKGQGVGLSFGGGAAEAVFGGQMGNVLTRTTVILAIVFLVNTTFLAVLILKHRGVSADVTDRFEEPAPDPVSAVVPAADPAAEPDGALLDVLDAPAAAAPEAPVEAPAAAAPEAPVEAPAAAAPETPVEAPAAAAPETPVEAPAEAAPEAPAAA
ncbi:MAG: preprotein translocase subunit SecG [Kiritimatiellae bacterium]|nr:preprotein translocase subunit SecG [Kiritimatiellia bacterium]